MCEPNRNTERAHASNSELEDIVTVIPIQQSQQQAVIPEETRIEIHRSHTSNDNLSRNSSVTMPNNLTSLLNQARTQIGRQTDSRRWEMNFRNVFQGVRPLVQRAQTMNSFRTLMPSNPYSYAPLRNESNRSEIDTSQNSFNAGGNATHLNNQSAAANEIPNENETTRTNSSDVNSPPARPILDRVAALTRDDPPDLIEGPSSNRRGGRQGNNGEDEDAVSEVFAQVPEARQAFNVFARYIPFICILLAKSAYDHLHGIADLTALGAIFMHANSTVRSQAIKQTQRELSVLARELLYIALIVFLRFFYSDENEFLGLLLIGPVPETISLGQLLFAVAVTDLLLKLITISIKIFIIILPPSIVKYKGRGRIFAVVESLSQLYRTLAPIQCWLVFLLDSYSGLEKILGVIFSAAYMVSKGFDIVERAKLCKKSFIGLLKKVNYGTIPTKEDIQTTGGQCPICHDNFDTPVMLECKHIFCELCVGTWFSKQQTCPLCRSKVADDPSWQDGATSFFLQLY